MDGKAGILLDRMMALCAKREYCEADIRRKLAAVEDKDVAAEAGCLSAAEADEIIAILKSEKFIDDFRYAKAFARDKAAISGWGKVKIRHMLRAKGIAGEAVNEAMSEIEGNPGLEKLSKALAVKAGALADDPHCRYKLLRFALGRGYEYEEVKALVDEAVARIREGKIETKI